MWVSPSPLPYLQTEFISTLCAHQIFLFFVEHDVCLETGNAGEFLPTLGTGGIAISRHMSGHVELQIVLHIE